MTEELDQLVNVIAPWGDLAALTIVAGFVLVRGGVVAAIVLADLVFVYFGQDFLKTLEFWQSKGLDYHYGLALKDCLIALILIRFRAKPVLILAYGVASVLSWAVWAAYVLLPYDPFLVAWYLWSPLYFIVMWVQVAGLWLKGDSDVGRGIGKRALFAVGRHFRLRFDHCADSRHTRSRTKVG